MIRLHNPHHSILLQQVEKLWRCGTLCDTVLETEGCTFEAHALVLACASKTLERHLSTQGGGPRYYCILDPLSARVLQQLLDYMYREWLEVSEEDMTELLRVAKSLRVEQLLEQCQAWLKSTTKQEEEGVPGLSSKVSAKGNYQEKRRGQPRDDLSPRSPLTKDPISQPSPPHVPSASPHRKRDGPSLSSRSLTLSRERPFTVTVDPTPSAALSQMSHLAWAPSRRMLLSPSDLLTIQSMRSSPHTLTYPYLSHHAAFAPPRRSLHAFGPASLQGCVSLLPPHRHLLLHNASPELKQGNLAKREPISAASAAALYEVKEERKPKMERGEKMCYRHSSTTLLENPWRQMSDPPPSTGQHAAAHECKFCKQNVRDRRRSLRRCANGEKPYQCQHCTKRFSLKHQLDTHLRVHTGEKPFECRLCGQRSRDYSAMIKHLRTHSGATPYQCTLCLEFCSSQTAMQKHLKAHPVQDFPPDWTLASTYLYTCHS